MTKMRCRCTKETHLGKLVVITGGPGAGKTAVLEAARRTFCEHVTVLPEAASILFSGGFPRHAADGSRRSAQRAIFFIQRELERMALEDKRWATILCDRGTVDGLAYWPGETGEFWADVASTHQKEMSRYAAVIHLRTPPVEHGYNNQNPIRIESAIEAAVIDERIQRAWSGHPQQDFVESSANFLEKIVKATELIRAEIPECCRDLKI